MSTPNPKISKLIDSTMSQSQPQILFKGYTLVGGLLLCLGLFFLLPYRGYTEKGGFLILIGLIFILFAPLIKLYTIKVGLLQVEKLHQLQSFIEANQQPKSITKVNLSKDPLEQPNQTYKPQTNQAADTKPKNTTTENQISKSPDYLEKIMTIAMIIFVLILFFLPIYFIL